MNNPPAFPSVFDHERGMTLRDYFAAQAMQSLVLQGEMDIEDCAIWAYSMADAMIKARSEA
jgi:hypothetical protein